MHDDYVTTALKNFARSIGRKYEPCFFGHAYIDDLYQGGVLVSFKGHLDNNFKLLQAILHPEHRPREGSLHLRKGGTFTPLRVDAINNQFLIDDKAPVITLRQKSSFYDIPEKIFDWGRHTILTGSDLPNSPCFLRARQALASEPEVRLCSVFEAIDLLHRGYTMKKLGNENCTYLAKTGTIYKENLKTGRVVEYYLTAPNKIWYEEGKPPIDENLFDKFEAYNMMLRGKNVKNKNYNPSDIWFRIVGTDNFYYRDEFGILKTSAEFVTDKHWQIVAKLDSGITKKKLKEEIFSEDLEKQIEEPFDRFQALKLMREGHKITLANCLGDVFSLRNGIVVQGPLDIMNNFFNTKYNVVNGSKQAYDLLYALELMRCGLQVTVSGDHYSHAPLVWFLEKLENGKEQIYFHSYGDKVESENFSFEKKFKIYRGK